MDPVFRSVQLAEKDYPPLLREIPHPPATLYIRGVLPKGHSLAIVGTRRSTAAGAAKAREFGRAMGTAGIPVVSGLAFGIDAAAHRGAIEGGGITVAVLANGVDSIYPKSHEALGLEILNQNGALVSEYPPGTPARDYQFLERNRIISGLCRAVLVIEAPERSGALATARFALEQNRDVYVLPGPAGHPNYRGAHRLIRDGATLVESPAMLLEDLGFSPVFPSVPSAGAAAGKDPLLSAIKEAGRALSIDEISEKTKLSPPEVNRRLTLLILGDAVQESAGKYNLL